MGAWLIRSPGRSSAIDSFEIDNSEMYGNFQVQDKLTPMGDNRCINVNCLL